MTFAVQLQAAMEMFWQAGFRAPDAALDLAEIHISLGGSR